MRLFFMFSLPPPNSRSSAERVASMAQLTSAAHVTQESMSSLLLRQPKRAHTSGDSFAGLPNHVWGKEERE